MVCPMLGCVETHCGLRDGLVRRIARNWFFSEAGVFELKEKFSEELRPPTYNAAQRSVYGTWGLQSLNLSAEYKDN